MVADDQQVDLRDMMLERQRILIRAANYIRSVLDLPPMAPSGVSDADADDSSPVAGLSVDQLSSLRLTHNRRAVLQAVLDVLRDGQDATYSVIRARSGVPERSVTRALRWAVETGVLRREGVGYRTGEGW
jgi:hypothetical protein